MESVGATGGGSVVELEGGVFAEACLGGSVVGPAHALGVERPGEAHGGGEDSHAAIPKSPPLFQFRVSLCIVS